jgi:Histidine phosphatase superfamily (branch 2)
MSEEKEFSPVHVQVVARHGWRAPLSPVVRPVPAEGNEEKQREEKEGKNHTQAPQTVQRGTEPSPEALRREHEGLYRLALKCFSKQCTREEAPLAGGFFVRVNHEGKFGDEPGSSELGACASGQLTDVGRAQMRALGRSLRTRYAPLLGGPPPDLTGNDDNKTKNKTSETDSTARLSRDVSHLERHLHVRSTDTVRTIESARSVIEGMTGLSGSSAVGYGARIPIHIRSSSEETMYPRSGCSRLNALRRAAKEADEMDHGRDTFLVETFRRALRRDPDWRPSWAGLHNNMETCQTHGCAGLLDQTGITAEMRESVALLAGRKMHTENATPEICRLGIGRFVGDLARRMDTFVEAASEPNNVLPERRFVYYSGHDNTLGPLLNALNIYDGKHPTMGAHMAFEIHERRPEPAASRETERFFVQTRYNAVVASLPECAAEAVEWTHPKSGEQHVLCPWSTFREILRAKVPQNYAAECSSTEKP